MNGAFLQSPEWERIQQQMGRATWRSHGILIVRHDLGHGFNYLYCARPELHNTRMDIFLQEARNIARAQHSIFLKIDPVHPLSFKHADAHREESRPLQPQQTIIIDISKSEVDLMAAMHEKTRYNIRLAERKGIEIVQAVGKNAEENVKMFWNLLAQTAARGEFHLHEKRYYELLLDTRTSDMSTELFFARMKEDPHTVLAAAMINFYHDPHTNQSVATYLHGGSSREHRELMAPLLLHWRIIQEAKKRAMMRYDLWGIDEDRWPGVTRFKKGFGGTTVAYPQSADIVYRPVWYMVYRLMKRWKK